MGGDIKLLYVEGGGMFVHPPIKFVDNHKKENKSQYMEGSKNGNNSKL